MLAVTELSRSSTRERSDENIVPTGRPNRSQVSAERVRSADGSQARSQTPAPGPARCQALQASERERTSSTSARRAAGSASRLVRRVDRSVSANARAKWRRRRSRERLSSAACRVALGLSAWPSRASLDRLRSTSDGWRRRRCDHGRLAGLCLFAVLRVRACRRRASLRCLCSQALHARARMDRVRRQHIDWHRPSTSSTPRPLTPRRSASLTMRKRRWATSSSSSCRRRDLRSPRAVRWSRCEP